MLYRRVALLDMDSYFASIECVRNLALARRPFAVIGHGEKTVVTSPNAVAKKYGVRTGMTLNEAKSLCPEIVFIKADFTYYEFTTLKIVQLIEKYFPVYKEASIDEFYIALDPVDKPLERLKDLKETIRNTLGLSCTIGVGMNPIVAKTACELSKPNGFFVVDNLREFSYFVDIKSVPGVGKSTAEILERLGIRFLSELLKTDFPDGSEISRLKFLITKEYTEPEFFKQQLPKSVGHFYTFDKNLRNFDEGAEILTYLLYGLYSKILRSRMGAKSLSVLVKFYDGTRLGLSRSLGIPVSDFTLLKNVVLEMLKKIWKDKPVVKMGVMLSNLKKVNGKQLSLFWSNEEFRYERLSFVEDVHFGGFLTFKDKKAVG
ncbi:DNA polymerase Y family protein [Fervidobacterium thailandense]|uniref:UmuC domain-containing protein n=1 Tax=Fervidobacterium thailandense TaxID=1008305 RepID=A0A1E3G5V5_9BACT|nr:DNA polymerase IV [Fervidobacterium thailandense]ODN31048.1 hypothetical protein A4H02_01890 [Fervidobacterium thailandense]